MRKEYHREIHAVHLPVESTVSARYFITILFLLFNLFSLNLFNDRFKTEKRFVHALRTSLVTLRRVVIPNVSSIVIATNLKHVTITNVWMFVPKNLVVLTLTVKSLIIDQFAVVKRT